VNKPAKDFLHKQFQQWYSTKVCRQFQGVDPKEPQIDNFETVGAV